MRSNTVFVLQTSSVFTGWAFTLLHANLSSVDSQCSLQRLVQNAFLSVLDCGDLIYMHSLLKKKIDVLYHLALCFITGAAARTHHCTMYEMVQWSSLSLRRKFHSLIFIAKIPMGKLPHYILNLLTTQGHQKKYY